MTIDRPMSVIKSPDPVYAMIESHKAISIAYDKAVNHPAVGNSSHPQRTEKERVSDRAMKELLTQTKRLFDFKPTTSAGVASLLRYISSLQVWQMPGSFSEPSEIRGMKDLCKSMATALEAATASAMPADNPAARELDDRALLEVGDRFDQVAKRQIEAEARCDELFVPIEEAIEAQATWPDDQMKWSRSDAQNYHAARGRVIEEIGAEWEALLDEIEGPLGRDIDVLTRAIWATPARSVAGLAVKARAGALACSKLWEEPFEKLDWVDMAARALIEATLEAAGLPSAPEYLGKEIAAEPAA